MTREQTTRVHTGARKRRLCVGAVLLLLAALAGAFYLAFFYEAPFAPPDFDPTAKAGIPDPPGNMGYGEISAKGGFTFSIAGSMYQQKDGSLCVYLTNPENSGVNLMCEVKDASGKVIYKSGVIRSGQYVERLSPLKKLPNKAMKIELNVYAFEPETWYSKGTISLANTLQPY